MLNWPPLFASTAVCTASRGWGTRLACEYNSGSTKPAAAAAAVAAADNAGAAGIGTAVAAGTRDPDSSVAVSSG